MKNLENFKLYTTDDFVLDEDFRAIVQGSDSNDSLKELLQNLPAKHEEINLAVQIINGLHVRKFQQDDKRKNDLWQQVLITHNRQFRLRFFKYAASLLLLIGAGGTIFYKSYRQPIDNIVIAKKLPVENATLILADGKEISISSNQSTVKYSNDGSGIMVNDTSGIAQTVQDEGLNQLIVPFGKRSYIMLSEGTRIWLNSGSKLIFPPVFKGKTREVYLEGEALFDVTKNIEKPFYVKTDAFKMKVYGTKFNIQAYQQDNDYNVVLIEGKVSMNSNKDADSKEIFLDPSQKAILLKGGDRFEVATVENTEIYTAWVDGYLTFVNEDVPVLLKRVSRYYNVTIETQLPENAEKIYGKLDLKDNLERVLDGIAFISGTKYEKEGEKYVFMRNQ